MIFNTTGTKYTSKSEEAGVGEMREEKAQEGKNEIF